MTSVYDLNGKVAVVTGGAGAIGGAICEKLASCGATVVVSDVATEKGEAFAKTLGNNSSFCYCDISKYESVQQLIDTVVECYGKLDIMVNNAGINTGKPEERVTTDQYPVETWHKIIGIDLDGTFYCCQLASRQMIKQGGGNIINVASVAGVVALRLQVGFVAAKAAIIRMSEAMACELGPKGIRVNVLSPGSTLFEGTRKLFYANKDFADRLLSFIPAGRPADVTEMGEAVAFLASDASQYMNGHNLIVDGGWTCGFNRDF
ncbi:MAG: SDR family oxidoreductase [Abditibacteriota bacterium]|nr:SDR family oxidoreductase [Abditibacteriota bacterium]